MCSHLQVLPKGGSRLPEGLRSNFASMDAVTVNISTAQVTEEQSMKSHEISRQIPNLRRFARAATGSVQLGDSMVIRVLEDIVADPGICEQQLPIRLVPFRLLCRAEMGAAVAAHWSALLLAALEEFSIAEAASILDIDQDRLKALLKDAAREIETHAPTGVLIIESEPLIALDLQQIVVSMGHSVVGIARTRREAATAAKAARPSVILCATRLADGGVALDAVNDILDEIPAVLIVTTSCPLHKSGVT